MMESTGNTIRSGVKIFESAQRGQLYAFPTTMRFFLVYLYSIKEFVKKATCCNNNWSR